MTTAEIQMLINGLLSARVRYQAKLQEIDSLLVEYQEMLSTNEAENPDKEPVIESEINEPSR